MSDIVDIVDSTDDKKSKAFSKYKDGSNGRINVTLPPHLYNAILYWAEYHQMKPVEYMRRAANLAVKRDNGDYDLHSAEIGRLNQIVDGMNELSHEVAVLSNVVLDSTKQILGLTRGDNYLLDESEDIGDE